MLSTYLGCLKFAIIRGLSAEVCSLARGSYISWRRMRRRSGHQCLCLASLGIALREKPPLPLAKLAAASASFLSLANCRPARFYCLLVRLGIGDLLRGLPGSISESLRASHSSRTCTVCCIVNSLNVDAPFGNLPVGPRRKLALDGPRRIGAA